MWSDRYKYRLLSILKCTTSIFKRGRLSCKGPCSNQSDNPFGNLLRNEEETKIPGTRDHFFWWRKDAGDVPSVPSRLYLFIYFSIKDSCTIDSLWSLYYLWMNKLDYCTRVHCCHQPCDSLQIEREDLFHFGATTRCAPGLTCYVRWQGFLDMF